MHKFWNQVRLWTARLFVRPVYYGALWLFAFVLLAAILLQLALWAGAGWLNTEAGRSWVESRIQTALAGSGYEVAFTGFRYSFPTGIMAEDLTISDQDGPFLDIDQAAFRISVTRLAVRDVAVALDAGHATLHRLPAGREEAPDQVRVLAAPQERRYILPPFTVPDLYFRSFTIARLHIDRLELAPPVTGQALTLPVQLSAALDLEQDQATLYLESHLEGHLDDVVGDKPPLWLPADIKMHLTLVPSNGLLTVTALDMEAPSYTLSLQGRAGLGTRDHLDLSAALTVNDLAAFVPAQPGRLHFNGRLRGTRALPVLDGSGRIMPEELMTRGLDAVDITITSADLMTVPQGQISLQSRYQDQPLSLAAAYAYDAPLLSLTEVEGSGPALTLGGTIVLDTETTLLSGTLAAALDDLSVYGALLDQDIAGSGRIEAALSYDTDATEPPQALDIDAALSAARYQDMAAEQISAQIHFPDLTRLWPGRTDIKAQGLRARDIRFDDLAFRLDPAEEDAGAYKMQLSGTGFYYSDLRLAGTAMLHDLDSDLRAARAIDLSLYMDGHLLHLTGDYEPDKLALQFAVDDFPLSAAGMALPFAAQGLRISGAAAVTGSPAQPVLALDADFSPLHIAAEAPPVVIGLQGRYEDGQLAITAGGTGEDIDALEAALSVPATFSFDPFVFELPDTAPLDGRFNVQMQTRALAASLLSPLHILDGQLAASGTIGGTVATPDYAGDAAFTQGSYIYRPYDIGFYDIEMQGRLDRTMLVLEELAATDGNAGTLRAQGRYALADNAQDQTRVTLDARDLSFIRGELASGSLSAALLLEGGASAYRLSGDITPGRFDINIPERFRRSIPELNIVTPDEEGELDWQAQRGPDIALDINVEAENQIFVRGWGLDAEMGGAFHIGGILAEPDFDGTLRVIRGRYEEFGQRFNIRRAELHFRGPVPPSPFLDVLAETRAEDITAQILLTGSAANPQIGFSSVPGLPEDEVLSRILFGRGLSNITPFQAVQLAQTLRRFSDPGAPGFDPLGQLRQVAGLDDLRIEADPEGGATVGAGKYLADNVYLELQTGAAEGSDAARLQIQLTPRITAESEIGEDARVGGSLFWEWSY